MALGITKAVAEIVRLASQLPDDLRAKLIATLEDIDESDVGERIGHDFGRGFMRGVLSTFIGPTALWRKQPPSARPSGRTKNLR